MDCLRLQILEQVPYWIVVYVNGLEFNWLNVRQILKQVQWIVVYA